MTATGRLCCPFRLVSMSFAASDSAASFIDEKLNALCLLLGVERPESLS